MELKETKQYVLIDPTQNEGSQWNVLVAKDGLIISMKERENKYENQI